MTKTTKTTTKTTQATKTSKATKATPNTNPTVTMLAEARRPSWCKDFAPSTTAENRGIYELHAPTPTDDKGVYCVYGEAELFAEVKRYQPRKVFLPDSFSANGDVEARADEIAFRRMIDKTVTRALNTLASENATDDARSAAKFTLVKMAYRVCVLDTGLWVRHTELDPNAERIATIIATYKYDGVELEGLPHEVLYRVMTNPLSTAEMKENALKALHRWATSDFSAETGSAVACLQERAYGRDVRRFNELIATGFKRTRGGVVDWALMSPTAFRKQCYLYLVSMIQGDLVDKKRMETAIEEARAMKAAIAAGRAAKEAKEPQAVNAQPAA